jgi:hypothetical protein
MNRRCEPGQVPGWRCRSLARALCGVVLLGNAGLAHAAEPAVAPTPVAKPIPPTTPPKLEQPDESISRGRYVAAGALGTLFGYGIGHAVAYEWSETGWIFTAGDLTLVTLIGLSQALQRTGDTSDATVPTVLVVGLVGMRVIEAIDIWTRPRVTRATATRGAQSNAAARWAAMPMLGAGRTGVTLLGRF